MNWKTALLGLLAVPASLCAEVAVDVSLQINEDIITKNITVQESSEAAFEEAGIVVSVRTIAQDDQGVELGVSAVKDEVVLVDATMCVAWDTESELSMGEDEQSVVVKVRPSLIN